VSRCLGILVAAPGPESGLETHHSKAPDKVAGSHRTDDHQWHNREHRDGGPHLIGRPVGTTLFLKAVQADAIGDLVVVRERPGLRVEST
jgi:hypothetical protein